MLGECAGEREGESKGGGSDSPVRDEGVASQPCQVGGQGGGGKARAMALHRPVRNVGRKERGHGLLQHPHGGGGGQWPLHRLVKHTPPTDCKGNAQDRIWIDRAS